MNVIVDKNGNEIKRISLQRISFQRICDWISKNISALLTIIPLISVAGNSFFNFTIYLFIKGKASYFNIPNEYVVINYKVEIYNIVIKSGIFLMYLLVVIWTVRVILRRQSSVGKVFMAILMDGILPIIFLFVVAILFFDVTPDIRTWSGEDFLYFLELSVFVIIMHGCMVVGFGYCILYPLHLDLIKEKKKVKSSPKVNVDRWKNRDYRIIGVILIVVGLVLEIVYLQYWGRQSVQNQQNFQITVINDNTYVVVMMDGDTAIVEKCDVGDGNTLKVDVNEYMKVECKNLLIQNKHFVNGIATEEEESRAYNE